jgi:monoamine oxidase
MPPTRRNFIKYVVAGSVAAGCPIDASLLAVPDEKSSGSKDTAPRIEGEHFEVCHQVRDGHQFAKPDATKKADVVIIGGGVAGLSAAYFLRGKDWLLLEKEDHFGGNAYQEEYRGAAFATGSAYAFKDDHGDHLAAELGLKLLPVDNPDPTIVNKTFVADTWNEGLAHLPYPAKVRASFKKFRDDVMKLEVLKNIDEFDSKPLTDFTAAYAPEIQQWWDGYGPSNWGATSKDTSAFVALAAMQGLVTGEDAKRVILPGGLGCITHQLVEVLQPQYKERMLGDATVVAVVPDKDSVKITYFHAGQLTTVSAKAVIMCTAKYITSRLVMGLPTDQKTAMRKTRYAPYPVVNAIFDQPVYNRGYDTWCPGNSFTDFIVADWTVRNTPGYHQKYNILSFYTPLREPQRFTLLEEAGCKSLAANVLADFQKLLPEFNTDPLEVRIYRRGHPMFMAVPGQYSKNRVAAAHAMERIYFSNNDSGGPESLTSEAIRLSQAGAEWAEMVLAGKPGAQAFAEKVLTTQEL